MRVHVSPSVAFARATLANICCAADRHGVNKVAVYF